MYNVCRREPRYPCSKCHGTGTCGRHGSTAQCRQLTVDAGCQLGRAAYSVSYARWGVELLFLANAEQMHPELFKVDDMLANLQYVLRVAGACVA